MRQTFKLGGGKNDPAMPPHVPSGYLGTAHLVGESKYPRWYLVHLMLCLVLIGLSLAAPFMESQTAWAATQTHLAPTSLNQVQLPKPEPPSWCKNTGEDSGH